MQLIRDTLKINEKKYDSAVEAVRECLGSYESIAGQCFAHTGQRVTGNAIRRWFVERRIPVEYAAVFSDLTFGEVTVTDFFPWLTRYVQ